VAAVVEAAGVETASCAVALLAMMNSAPNIIGKFFMKFYVDLIFKVVVGMVCSRFSEAVKRRLHRLRTAIQAKWPNDYSA
jgi:hypothetical protein